MRIPLRGAVLVAAAAVTCGLGSGQESAQLFAAPAVIATTTDSFRIAPDLNGDGDKDAVSVWLTPGSARVAGWWNDGTGVLTPGWSVVLALTFNPPPGFNTTIHAHFASGDLNGDGADDFVGSLQSTVGWWISNGDVVLPVVPWSVVMPDEVLEVAVADFDLDGRGDVAVMTAQELRIYRTMAAGPPVLVSTLAVPGDGLGVVAADLNGDSTPDVAVLRVANVELHPVLAGVIQPGTTFGTTAAITASLVAGDVDNDGDADLVASATIAGTMTTGPQIVIAVLRRAGPASFVPDPSQVFPMSTVPRALVDADGDGDLDLFSIDGLQGISGPVGPPLNLMSQPSYLRRNDGNGTFAAAEYSSILGATTDFAATDLDGDGDIDLLAGRCVAFATDGRGFAPDPVPRAAYGVAAAGDVDRDGDPDVTPGISGLNLAGGIVPGTAVNDGAGGFVDANSVAPPPAPGTSWAGPGFTGDFDGDGDLDLVVEHLTGTNPSAGFEMRFLANLGGGAFADGGPATAMGATMRVVPTDAPAGSSLLDVIGTASVLSVDVDGDGDVDLVPFYPPASGGNFTPRGSKVWLNDGAGSFTASTDLPNIRPSAAGDVTGDGIPDLLAMQGVTGNFGSLLVLLPGLGGGAFAAPVLLASVPYPDILSFPGLADIDGDGDKDVLFVVFGGVPNGALTAFVNDGLGNLSPTAIGPFEWTAGNVVVRVADLNGDGLVDLLASAYDRLSVFLHHPTSPGWLAPRTWSTALGTLADADGDGDLDLLSAGAGPAGGNLYRNRTHSPPANGFRKQYGTGLAGSAGLVPILGSWGALRAGSTGAIRISNALGGALALFAAGTAQANQPVLGGTLLVVPDMIVPFTLGGAPGLAGAGFLDVPWTIQPGLAGFQAFEQVAIQDPGAPQGWAFTQGVQIVIGS
jgi:FG-GAP-like repeat